VDANLYNARRSINIKKHTIVTNYSAFIFTFLAQLFAFKLIYKCHWIVELASVINGTHILLFENHI